MEWGCTPCEVSGPLHPPVPPEPSSAASMGCRLCTHGQTVLKTPGNFLAAIILIKDSPHFLFPFHRSPTPAIGSSPTSSLATTTRQTFPCHHLERLVYIPVYITPDLPPQYDTLQQTRRFYDMSLKPQERATHILLSNTTG
jgi:hypothetical protein